MTDIQVLRALSRIYRITEAGERGFATAATNADRRALKLLFKSFAVQRAQFKAEILAELQRLGGNIHPRSSILGMIHRGRVAIFAVLTIEDDKRERVVLKEAAFGEKFAIRAYKQSLQADLPAETRELLNRQFEEVLKVVNQIHLMLGKDGQGLVTHLFDTEEDADLAVQLLQRADIAKDSIEKVALEPSANRYHIRGTTVAETILSGMFGGTLWGSLIGTLAGIGALQTTIPSDWFGVTSVLLRWAIVALGTTVIAALGGGFIGLFIGAAISEDDTHVYQQSIQQGRYLVNAVVDIDKTKEAILILDHAGAQPIGPVAGTPA